MFGLLSRSQSRSSGARSMRQYGSHAFLAGATAALCMAAICDLASAAEPEQPAGFFATQDLFVVGSDPAYQRYHIPGIVVTAKGTVLAWCEARRQESDWGDIRILLRRSTDDGRTWSEPRRLTKPHQHPADVTLLQSGNLLLTYGNRIGDLAVGAVLSHDLGRTWDWDHRVVLARHSLILRGKTWGDCGYPTTVQVEDGTINTLYYRLGHNELPQDQQELCRQYERDEYDNPPVSEDIRRFEEGICVRYSEEQLTELFP